MQGQTGHQERQPEPDMSMATDPVCGMSVSRASPASLRRGWLWGRLLQRPLPRALRVRPSQYQSPGKGEQQPAATKAPAKATGAAAYTCPMHPEIVRDGPGTCPICGMALEPERAVAAEEGRTTSSVDMTRRFWFAAALTLPLLVLAMGDMLPAGSIRGSSRCAARTLVELALATPVCVWAAWPFYVRAIQSVRQQEPQHVHADRSRRVRRVRATASSPRSSPASFPPPFAARAAEVAVYFEAAAVIVTLILLGQVLELRARSATGAAIKQLLGLAPKTARRIKRRRFGGGCSARRRRGRRPAAGAPGREGPGRRRRARGRELHR